MMNPLCSRFLLKMITITLLMVIIARFKAEQCSKNGNYQIVSSDGPPLHPKEIISSHNVEPTVQVNCNFLCYQEPKCVGFNFKTKTSDKFAVNCQLTNTTKRRMNIREGNWTLFDDVDAKNNENELKKRPEAQSCANLYKSGVKQDGVYTIDPDGGGYFQVRCGMQTDGGGWTVFQRRQDASVDFYRGWQDYKNGFGDLNGNFWLGLDKIHRLTKSGENVLQVDLTDFDNTTAYAKYRVFTVASESESYKLVVGNYSGNAGGHSLSYHNGMMFSTQNRDNDLLSGNNCAVTYHGAWWYNSCRYSNLNGQYQGAGVRDGKGIIWYHWKVNTSMKKTGMKMRPVQS